MEKKISVYDMNILVEYVEAQAAHVDIDSVADCGCDDCAALAQRTALVLKSYGYPHEYADGALSIDAVFAAERLYTSYCVRYGHTPTGVSM